LVGCGHVSGLFCAAVKPLAIMLCADRERRRLGKNFLSCCSIGRVRSCVRPVLCGGEAAGHNALRGSGPNQKHAFKDALTQTGSPDLRIDLVCITSSCPRQFLQTSNAVVVSWPHLLESPCFDANQSIALRCRRVGAVHSSKAEKLKMSTSRPLCTRKRTSTDPTGMSG